MVGRYSIILEDSGSKAVVTGFSNELGKPLTVPVVTAAVAYDLRIYWKNVHFSHIQRALLPKHLHKSGTSRNDASHRARRR